MGAVFGLLFVGYFILAGLLVPATLLELRNERRDCEIENNVAQCRWILQPVEREEHGG